MVYKTATLLPAYGRDYMSRENVLDAWANGRDFFLVGLERKTYVNRGDLSKLREQGYTHLSFRYNNRRSVIVVKIERDRLSMLGT